MDDIISEVKAQITANKDKIFASFSTDPKIRAEQIFELNYINRNRSEFVTMTMVNKTLHMVLKNMKISEDLANRLGIPQNRDTSMWSAVINLFRKALGMKPSDTSAIEAVMHISEKSFDYMHPRMAIEGEQRRIQAADKLTPQGNPQLASPVDRLREEVSNSLSSQLVGDPEAHAKLTEALSDPKQFLANVRDNTDLQKLLKGVKISPELKQEIGLPKWRTDNAWNAAQHIMGKEEGRGPRGEPKPAVAETPFEREQANTVRQTAQMGEEAEKAPRDLADRVKEQYADKGTALQETGYRAWLKVAFSDTVRIASEHLFGPKDEGNSFRRVQELIEKQGQLINSYLNDRTDLMNKLSKLMRTAPDRLGDIITLLSEAADYNVHPDMPLGEDLNKHLNVKNPDHNVSMENAEGYMAHPRLSDTYNKMHPDDQALFRELRDTMMDEGRKNSTANLKNLIDGVRLNHERDKVLQAALKKNEADRTPAEIKKVERYNAINKVINKEELTKEELEAHGSDPHIQSMNNLRNLLKKSGPYFPSARKGVWVVNAEHNIPDAPNAASKDGHVITFHNREDAFNFRQKLVDASLPSHMEQVHEPTSTTQKPGEPKQYRVIVQNKHSSAYESLREANKAADALRKSGAMLSVDNPMIREKNSTIEYGLHSGTLREMDHAIDAMANLDDRQKQELKDSNRQAAMSVMRGNRVNAGLMKRNRVRGANGNPVRVVHDYFTATARNRARAETQPGIDRGFEEMRDTARDTQDADTWKRGMIVKEMEDRILNFGKAGFTSQMPTWLQNLSTMAFLKYMAAPIHYALDLTHPYLVSIPQLAARHGFVRAHTEFQKALNLMGGRTPALVKGLQGAWRQAWDGTATPTDFLSGIRETMVKNGADFDLLRALDQAIETNALHSIVMDFQRHYDKTGLFQTGMDRVQGIGQEMSSAVDAINRMATFIAGYNLERSKMGEVHTPTQNAAHHAQAMQLREGTYPDPNAGPIHCRQPQHALKEPASAGNDAVPLRTHDDLQGDGAQRVQRIQGRKHRSQVGRSEGVAWHHGNRSRAWRHYGGRARTDTSCCHACPYVRLVGLVGGRGGLDKAAVN